MNDNLRSVLYFDTMLMPKIITFIYWLLLVGVVISSLGMMFGGNFVGSIGLLVLGSIGARLWCEFIILFFKINENIQKLADQNEAKK